MGIGQMSWFYTILEEPATCFFGVGPISLGILAEGSFEMYIATCLLSFMVLHPQRLIFQNHTTATKFCVASMSIS